MSTAELGVRGASTENSRAGAPAGANRSVTIRGREWPVQLPSIGDARLHTAGVVMTIHVLGQVTLGFAVSVPQIVAAILGSAVVEFAITVRRRGVLAWPASAILTGSGVGLIFRVNGTVPGDHWSFHRWWWFSAVAVGSLLTKYVVRWRGTHLFNPSNVGLVVAFVVLGSRRAEPLPFHWSDPGPGLTIAYVVIIVGGVLITRHLGLLPMAVTFWVALAAGVGVLAWSGHCMNVPWSLQPVCDAHFWRSVALSPEVCVFLFFMLTDPRTVPADRRSRIVFAVAVALVATLLIAPQRTEFGAKVALLGSLTIVCASRPLVAWARRRFGPSVRAALAQLSADSRGVLAGLGGVVAVVVFAVATISAGAHARSAGLVVSIASLPPVPTVAWSEPSFVPDVTVQQDALDLDPTMADPEVRRSLLLAVLRNLEIEATLMQAADGDTLAAVDHGARLSELRSALSVRSTAELDAWPSYAVTAAELMVRRAGGQGGAVLALDVTGFRVGAGDETPWSAVIAVRQAADGRWLIVEVTPP